MHLSTAYVDALAMAAASEVLHGGKKVCPQAASHLPEMIGVDRKFETTQFSGGRAI
jgi:hypothetical protein